MFVRKYNQFYFYLLNSSVINVDTSINFIISASKKLKHNELVLNMMKNLILFLLHFCYDIK